MQKRKNGQLRVPKLGLHKASGIYRVTFSGKTFYLGRDRLEAEREHRELVGHWLATGEIPGDELVTGVYVVADLVAAFTRSVRNHALSSIPAPFWTTRLKRKVAEFMASAILEST